MHACFARGQSARSCLLRGGDWLLDGKLFKGDEPRAPGVGAYGPLLGQRGLHLLRIPGEGRQHIRLQGMDEAASRLHLLLCSGCEWQGRGAKREGGRQAVRQDGSGHAVGGEGAFAVSVHMPLLAEAGRQGQGLVVRGAHRLDAGFRVGAHACAGVRRQHREGVLVLRSPLGGDVQVRRGRWNAWP